MTKTDLSSIGDRLRFLREHKGYTHTVMAVILKVDRQQVYYWENNTHKPNVNNILKYSNYFGVTTDWILKGE